MNVAQPPHHLKVSMYQRTEILGYVGKDPEIRYLPDGKAVANFSIATTEKWKDKSGERQEHTEWHRCTAFERLAEITGEYVKKGSLVLVAGKLKTRKYTDQSGIERYSTEVTLSELKLLPSPDRDQQGQQDNTQQQQRPAPRPAAAPGRPAPAARSAPPQRPGSGFDDMDDDIPFRDPLKNRAFALCI